MRYLVRTSPFREIDAWQKAFDRFFHDDFFGGENNWYNLALDVSEDENSLKVEASLPGLKPEDVDIAIQDGVLTIKGAAKHEDKKDVEGKYYLRERRYGSFQRAIRLPVEVNTEAAEAVFENGVLHLTLPKAEEDKPKRIAVKAG